MSDFQHFLCAYGRMTFERHQNLKILRIRPVAKAAPKPRTPGTVTEEKKPKIAYTAAQYFGDQALKGGRNYLTINTDAKPILPALLKEFTKEVVDVLPALMQSNFTDAAFDEIIMNHGRISKFILSGVGQYNKLIGEIPNLDKAITAIKSDCSHIVPMGQDFAKVQFINSYCARVFNDFLKVLGVLFTYRLMFQLSSTVDETMFAGVMLEIATTTRTVDLVDDLLNKTVPVEQPSKPIDLSGNPADALALIRAEREKVEARKRQQEELAKQAESSPFIASLRAAEAQAQAQAAAQVVPQAAAH